MCGISCTVTLRGHGPASDRHRGSDAQAFYKRERANLSTALDASLETIKHRGPDDRGHWISDNCRVSLGHVRLSIVDLSENAQQPFHAPGGDIHAVVSGEFYEYERIRADLLKKGYSFQSNCDSEIVIALYKEYGMNFLEHLRGEFAFCLYDSKAQYFIAVRDRYGVKPLFYTIHDGKLLIASEQKAFLPFGWKPEWDVQSIVETGWLSDRRTLFAGVQKILPGHYLAVQSFENLHQEKYWDMEYEDKHKVETQTEDEMILAVREKLLDAVRVRLRADVPVGIFLSGGLDSSTIAGMVKHLIVEEGTKLGDSKTDLINCFSIKFHGDDYDEEPIARRTAEWLGVKTHIVEMTEELFVELFEDACFHNELSMIDLNFIGKFALSRLTRDKGVKVILTGEGSDEHFAGYGDLLTDFLREPDYALPHRSLPEDFRIEEFEKLEYRKAVLSSLKHFRPLDPPTAAWPRKQINNIGFIGFTQFASSDDQMTEWVAKETGFSDKRTAAVHNGIDGMLRRKMSLSWHPLHTALYLWSRCLLSNVLLTALGDRVEMAHSIEGRQPFLDHHLTEYVNKLPPTMKYKYNPETRTFKEKWILNEAAKPFITEELYKRQKHPFSAPINYKVGGPLHKYLQGIVTKEAVEQVGFLDWNKCKNLLEDGVVGKDGNKFRKMLMVAQFILLQRRFGARKAEPEYPVDEVREVVENGHVNCKT